MKEAKEYTSSKSVGFGPTFEWYVAAVCLDELSSIAYWGVEIENLTGDCDVVVVRENKVGYIECKRGKLRLLVDFAREQRLEYDFEMPGVMDKSVSLKAEHYKNFIRLIPINSFFVTVKTSVASTLREIYEFLTLVCDRTLPTENMAAKAKFR